MLASIILPSGPFLQKKEKKNNNATIIPLFYFIIQFTETAYQSSELSTALGFTQSDMVVQPSPAESHTSDFLLTCNSDLPSVLTWHLDCGSVSLPSAV